MIRNHELSKNGELRDISIFFNDIIFNSFLTVSYDGTQILELKIPECIRSITSGCIFMRHPRPFALFAVWYIVYRRMTGTPLLASISKQELSQWRGFIGCLFRLRHWQDCRKFWVRQCVHRILSCADVQARYGYWNRYSFYILFESQKDNLKRAVTYRKGRNDSCKIRRD